MFKYKTTTLISTIFYIQTGNRKLIKVLYTDISKSEIYNINRLWE